MGYFIGATLALAVGVFGTRAGLDRDRAFYPTVMIVIAAYCIHSPPTASRTFGTRKSCPIQESPCGGRTSASPTTH